MKKIKLIFVVISVFLPFLLSSCSNSNNNKGDENKSSSEQTTSENNYDKFLGTWKSITCGKWASYNLIITKDGENYIIKTSGTATGTAGEYISTRDNGKLKVTLPLTGVSELTWSSNNDEIYFDGNKFKKTN